MGTLTVSLIVFACVFGGALLGMLLRATLPEKHLSPDSKDVIKLSMGLIGTMTALVLGLLIATAKSSFDSQRNGLTQLAADVIVLDRTLERYGKETQKAREFLHASVADMLQRTWPDEKTHSEQAGTEGRYEGLFEKIQELTPKNDVQRTLKDQAMKTASDAGQTRWLMFAEQGSSIPSPFLVVLVFWLFLILASFGLLAPRNATTVVALIVCALAISSAIFLILELDRPFKGMIQISSAPLRSVLAKLGH